MNEKKLKKIWKQEEERAHIQGWDFSHIHGRYEEENDLPWDYEKIVRAYLSKNKYMMDYDTGGGEFLLSLGHPNEKPLLQKVMRLMWNYAETNCYLSGLISENATIQAKFHLTMLRLSL